MRPATAIYTAFDDHDPYDGAKPERNLMRAILRTAMDDMRKSGNRNREARKYFLSNDTYYVYSFLSVCYHLDLCPRTIRTLLGLAPIAENHDATAPENRLARSEYRRGAVDSEFRTSALLSPRSTSN